MNRIIAFLTMLAAATILVICDVGFVAGLAVLILAGTSGFVSGANDD